MELDERQKSIIDRALRAWVECNFEGERIGRIGPDAMLRGDRSDASDFEAMVEEYERAWYAAKVDRVLVPTRELSWAASQWRDAIRVRIVYGSFEPIVRRIPGDPQKNAFMLNSDFLKLLKRLVGEFERQGWTPEPLTGTIS